MLPILFFFGTSVDFNEICDLKCYIQSLVFPIEDISIGGGIGARDITISSISVNDFSFEEDQGNQNYFKVVVNCDGTMSGIYYDALTSGYFNAIATRCVFTLKIQLIKDSDGFVEEIKIEKHPFCNYYIGDLKINTNHVGLRILGTLAQSVKNIFQAAVCSEIEKLGTNLTEMIQPFNNLTRQNLKGSEPLNIPINGQMIKLDSNVIFRALNYITTNLIENGGPFHFNKLFARITDENGKFTLSNLKNVTELLNITNITQFNIPIPAVNSTLTLIVDDFFINGLTSFNGLELLRIVDNYNLYSNINLSDFEIGVRLSFLLKDDNPEYSLGQKISAGLKIKDNKFGFIAQVGLPKGRGTNYSNNQCMDVNCIGALFSKESTAITNINISTTLSNASLSLLNGQLGDKFNVAINNLLKYISDHFGKFTGAFITGMIRGKALPLVNTMIAEKIGNSSCEDNPDEAYKDIDMNSTIISLVVLGGFGVAFIIFVIYFATSLEFCKKFFRTDEHASLLMTPKLPLAFRLAIPMVLLLVFALFVSSNTGLGASVFGKIYLGSGKRIGLSLFDFGLINSILDMWHSGSYVLAVLIAIMSCAWPYTKIVFMFIVWCLPSSIIKPHQREKAVEILDILGKWSLVDSYVMILMLIAFRMKINLPPTEDELDVLQINLFVYPAWGFVTLIVGTILSLGCSQIILAAERYVDKKELLNHQIQLIIEEQEKKKKREEYSEYSYSYSYSYSDSGSAKKGKKKKLSNLDNKKKKAKNNKPRTETVEEDDGNKDEKETSSKKKNKNSLDGKNSLSLFMYCNSWLWKILLTIVLIAGIITFIFGTKEKAFSFEFVGLAGWALQLVNADQYREYSAIDLAVQLPQAAEDQNSFGIRITQAVYILVTNLIPIIHLVCLSFLWIIPLKIKYIHIIERACEYMYSWACLDVFVISIVAAVMEISQLAKFMNGDRCVVIDVITKEYFSQEELIKDHLTCFDVVTKFLNGSYYIIAAAIFHTIATIGIGKVTKKLNRDLAEIEKEKRDQSNLSPLLNNKD